MPPSPQYPTQQQPPAAHPAQQQYEAELFGEIVRAMVHLIAKDMHSDLIDQLAALPNGHQDLIAILRMYNDDNEHKIRNRKRPQASATFTRRRADGTPDYFNDANAAVKALFDRGLKGRK
jgi:hypothetical protein